MADDLMLTGAQAAYIGDAVWNLFIKKQVVLTNIRMAKTTIMTHRFVNASIQATIVLHWLDQGILTDQEILWFKQGRNIKINHPSNHKDIANYRYASGFEAILGYLYMTNAIQRLDQLLDNAYTFMVGSL